MHPIVYALFRLISHNDKQAMGKPRRTRTVWTSREKHDLVMRASSIQRTRPDLAGLSLLKAAMKSMPEARRRRIISLTQVPWFELGLRCEAEIAEAARAQSVEAELQKIGVKVDHIIDLLEQKS